MKYRVIPLNLQNIELRLSEIHDSHVWEMVIAGIAQVVEHLFRK